MEWYQVLMIILSVFGMGWVMYANLGNKIDRLSENVMKEIRCIVCRTEFTEDEVKETAKNGCPVCGYQGMTMFTNGDLNIDINWFELRLICMWAEALALQMGDDHSLNAFYSTINEIVKQLPECGRITMFDKPPAGEVGMGDEYPPPETTLH